MKPPGRGRCLTRVRALLVVCVLAAAAAAAPKYTRDPLPASDPDIAEAERLWTVAEHEPDPRKQTEAWDAASAAFAKIAEAGKVSPHLLHEAAYTAVLALKNALNADPRVKLDAPQPDPADFAKAPVPQPVPPREAQLLHVLDVSRKYDSTSDEAVGLQFLRANILRRHDHFAEAIPIFRDIIEHHPDHEVAEYSANLLLDIYNRSRDFAQLIALADQLRADKKFLAKRPELAATLAKIHAQDLGHRAQEIERRARETGDRTLAVQCGDMYAAMVDEAGLSADELLYNALVCYEEAGSIGAALAMVHRIDTQFPKSRIRSRAIARASLIERQIGWFAESAAHAETYSRTYAGEREAFDAATDAALLRIALGDLDAATRDVKYAVATYGAKRPELLQLPLELIAAQLAAGRRSDATHGAQGIVTSLRFASNDESGRLHAAQILTDAACPVALLDELCPRPRDAKLVAAARGLLRPLLAGSEHAMRLAFDLDLDDALAKRPGARPLDAIGDDYRRLIVPPFAPATRIAAHERLGRLAAHAKDPAEAALHLQTCTDEATAALTGAEWLARCERQLVELKLIAPRQPEHVPHPASPAPLALEQ